MITLAQFKVLVTLMRGDLTKPGNLAAKCVLVEGLSQADAMRATGASRSTVWGGVKRYLKADQLIREAYVTQGYSSMKAQHYEALVKLVRGDITSPGNVAVRKVLIDGFTQADAMRETGSSRATISNGVKRYREMDILVREAYQPSGTDKGRL